MEFRTILKPMPFPFTIDYHSKIILSGSCFSNHIGLKLNHKKFDALPNPFGTTYNAITLSKQLNKTIQNRPVLDSEINFNSYSGVYSHFDFHSDFNRPDQHSIIEGINSKLDATRAYLLEATHCIITLGTSFVYEHKVSKSMVGNCHKFPAQQFTKRLLTVEEQLETLSSLVKMLTSLNPQIQFLLTVSPIRHIKEGLPENNLSKSILTIVCHQLAANFKHVHYFPAYEILMDDLRDYRFYEKDMIHPNMQAIDYIWNRFCEAFFDSSTMALMKQIERLALNKSHKYFNPESNSSLHHQNKTKADEEALYATHPFLKNR